MAESSSNIVIVLRNGETRQFSSDVWENLPDHKYGWVKKEDDPEEVKELKATTKTPDKNQASNDDEPVKVNAAELAKQIYEAKSIEEIAALLPEGETRITVLKAVEDRKKQLTENS